MKLTPQTTTTAFYKRIQNYLSIIRKIRKAVIAVSLSILILNNLGCANRTIASSTQATEVSLNPSLLYSLEDLMATNQTAKDVLKSEIAIDDRAKDIRSETYKEQARKNSSKIKKLSHKEIVSGLKNKDYEKVKDVKFENFLGALVRLSDSQMDALAEDLAGSWRCKTTADLYFSAAVVLERKLPNSESFKLTQSLYEKVNECPGSEDLAARANYRSGILNVLNNNCSQAVDNLNRIRQLNNRNFTSRAEYWADYCSKNTDQDRALKYFLNFPISYHGILSLKKADTEAADLVFAKDKTGVLLRSISNPSSNAYLIQIENNIQNAITAKSYLNLFTDDVLNKLEPEHLLYVGYLAHRLEDDLKAFQALAKAITRKPQLKTKSVVRLYYPFRYKDEIKTHSKAEEIDPVLVTALIRQESAFNKNATSRVGARGLMQLMPATARKLDRKLTAKNLTDVNKNLQAGTKYLSKLLKRYDNNVVYALAAYNAGFGNVDVWIKRYKTGNDMVFMDAIPFQETREYVSSILRNYYWYDQLNKDFSKPKVGNALGLNSLLNN